MRDVVEHDGGILLTRVQQRLQKAGSIANAAGAIDTFLFTALLLPTNAGHANQRRTALINAIAFVPFFAATMVVGQRWGKRESERLRPWLESGRSPTAAERDHALRLAFVQSGIAAAMWLAAAVFFTVLNAIAAPDVFLIVPVVLI